MGGGFHLKVQLVTFVSNIEGKHHRRPRGH
jgi:hypothetical protein